jgi:ectoine hydroxylase
VFEPQRGAAMPPDTARFTESERVQYQTEGYVIRRSVFTLDEVRRIREACESLVDKLVRNRNGERVTFGSYVFDADMDHGVIIKWEGNSDVVHGIEPFAHLSAELEQWAYDSRFVDPMRDIIGVDQPALFTEKLNLKRPLHGGQNPLHQDYPYWVRVAEEASEVATSMLFLDDSTLENGCLHVVPGSHLDGPWQGRADGDRFAANEIDRDAYTDLNLVPVEVPAGSVVMFGPLLVHQSAPNLSDKERRAILYSYQPPGRRTQLEALMARAS